MLKKLLVFPFFTLLAACAPPSKNTPGVSVGYLSDHCEELLNKTVVVEGYYLGWGCPPDCGAPPLSRSDTCLADRTGCIYLYSTGGLNPVSDKGKKVLLTAVVKKSPSGVCYLKVVKAKKVED